MFCILLHPTVQALPSSPSSSVSSLSIHPFLYCWWSFLDHVMAFSSHLHPFYLPSWKVCCCHSATESTSSISYSPPDCPFVVASLLQKIFSQSIHTLSSFFFCPIENRHSSFLCNLFDTKALIAIVMQTPCPQAEICSGSISSKI
jgi:hypothetical protein